MNDRVKQVGRQVHAALDVVATLMVIAASGAVLAYVWSARRLPTAPSPPTATNAFPIANVAPRVPTKPHSLAGAILLGNPKAGVAIVQYSDFECSFCATFASETWPTLKRDYVDSGKVLMAFRHLPLSGHHYAKGAAVGANCAGEQGRFWEMHDALFSKRAQLAADTVISAAASLRLDGSAFKRCVEDYPEFRIANDGGFAAEAGISGTPTFLVGLRRSDNTVQTTDLFLGVQPIERFRQVLEALLQPAS